MTGCLILNCCFKWCLALHVNAGESKNPEVELVSVEDYQSEYELGEMADVTAQRLIRFPTLVPFIYLQEKFTVRNCMYVNRFQYSVLSPKIYD